MNDYIVRKYLEKRMFKDKTKYIDRPIKTTGLTERMIESFIEYEKKDAVDILKMNTLRSQ